MKTLIYLMGVDGSGKTTLSANFIRHEQEHGRKAAYIYARYFPFLSQPLKLASRIFLYRKNSEFGNFERYSSIKSDFGKKHSLLSRIYTAVCLTDYLLQTLPRFYFTYWRSSTIILDRYVADLAVTLTVASSLSSAETLAILRLLHRFFPKPTRAFFIDVDVKTAFSRKDDIPSEKYLVERRALYLSFSEFYGIEMIDGHLPQEALTKQLYTQLNQQKEL
jgi:thymidylate kinase